MIATCATCAAKQPVPSVKAGGQWLWEHDLEHRGITTIQQLADVEFIQAFCLAVAAMPIGTRFTTADLHGVVADPPDHHWWGKAQGEARRRGLCRVVGTQPSELGTTKDSLVRQWERCAVPARSAA